MFKIGPMGDFYGGPVVKNLPSKTEDACLIPGQGTKIPHTAGQRSLHATSREAHVVQLEKTGKEDPSLEVLGNPKAENEGQKLSYQNWNNQDPITHMAASILNHKGLI